MLRSQIASNALDFRAVFHAQAGALMVLDLQGRILEINASGAEILGLAPVAARGQIFASVIRAALTFDGAPLREDAYPMVIAIRTGLPVRQSELLIHRLDGIYRSVLVDIEPIRNDCGTIAYLVGSYTDITLRRQAESALQASEERFRALLEQAPEAILVFDLAQNRLVQVSRKAEDVFGRSRMDILQGDLERLFSARQPDGRPLGDTNPEYTARALAGEEVVYERIVCNPLRGERHCEVRLVLLPSPSHPLLRASYIDITDRRQAENTVHTLSQAIEQSPVSVVITDPTGAIAYVNPTFCAVTGFSAEEALSRNPRMLKSGLTPPETYTELWRTVVGGGTWHGEFVNRKKNGEVYWEQASVAPIRNAQGEITQYVAVKEDITEQRRIVAALQRANRALAAITACNQAIVRATSEEDLLAQVCQAIADVGGYVLAWVGYKRDDAERTLEPVAWAGPEAEYARTISVSWGDVPTGRGPAGKTIRSGLPYVMRNIRDEPEFEPWRQAALGRGFASTMTIPLVLDGNVFAVLCIYAPEPDAFDGEEQRLLEGLADELAHGIAGQRAQVEKERIGQALRHSEAQFRASFQQAAVGMLRASSEGRILEVNEYLCQLLGYRHEELLTMRWQDVTHPEDAASCEEWLEALSVLEHPSGGLEKRYLHRDGSIVWGMVSAAMVRDAQGRTLFVIAAVQDITLRKRAEAALSTSEARLRAMFEQAGVGIAVSDHAGTWQVVNARLGALLGYAVHELVGHHFREFMHPEEREDDIQLDQRMRAGMVAEVEVENRYVQRSGQVVWMRVSVGTILDAEGLYEGAVAMFQDITARKQAEEAVRQAAAENALLAAAVDTTSVGVVVTDPTLTDNPIVYVNPAFLQITGYTAREVLGRNCRLLQGDDTNRIVRQAMRDAVAEGKAFSGTVRNYRKDGTPFWNEVRFTPILDAQQQLCNFVGLQTDVSERVHLQEELERLALHDPLTGLPNRALLLDRTAQATLSADRQNSHAALLLLDLDHFKEVNDTFGHSVGDDLLRQVAERLREALRTSDTVARLGGDEFAVLLPATDAQGAVAAAAHVQQILSEPVVLKGRSLRPDASIGIALCPEHGTDAAALLQHADVAMYQAKRARRTSILYQPKHDVHTPDRAALIDDLRRAIGQSQLRLHYQPLVEMRSGKVMAVEALVRWQHPERGLLYPDAFLALVEDLGLQGELTRWVLTEGLRQQLEWQEHGLEVVVNINLAASDLQDEGLLAEIAHVLSAADRPSRVCLELTEGALPADLTHTRAALLRLAAAGAQIAIDDYGTGYSSLSRLARLPMDELKIDRLFVAAMLSNPVDAAIVASTIGLAHSLGVQVVAEGAEDEDTMQQLRGLDCDAVQGYCYSRPLPPDELERWLHARQLLES